MKNAQASAAVAATLIKGAAKVSIAVLKATYSGAKYAHERGWDKKAVGAASSAASAAKGLMNSRVANAAITTAMGSPWDAATNFAAGETIANSVPIQGFKEKFETPKGKILYVAVPPNAGPGTQMCVLSPSGQQIVVVVPEGATPGTQFPVQLP